MRRIIAVGSVVIALFVAVGYFATGRPAAGAPRTTMGPAVGDRVPAVEFRDLAGRRGRLADLRRSGAVVVIMRDGGCPVAQRYGPTIGRLEREFAELGVEVVYVNVNGSESAAQMSEDAARFGLTGRYVRDTDWKFARVLQPHSTVEAFVIDAAGTLRYRGAIDDQYGLSYTRAAPTRSYLREAVVNVLAGQPVAVPSTRAEGCLLAAPERATPADAPVTYHNRISRLVQQNCQSCHRAGGVAPFALERYDQVKAYAPMIRYVIESGRMPPWFAHADVGEWANERRLPERDVADLFAWIEAGMPEGRRRQAPLPMAWAEGWNIGQPSAVIPIPESFDIPAEGMVEYQYMYVKTDFPEDRWVQAMEIRPTAPQVTHHVLVFLEDPDAERKQGGIAGFFAGYAPGNNGTVFPPGMAKLLPKGAWLKFQLHYTANGQPATDRSELALVFADEPPQTVVHTRSAFNVDFVIPPGARRHEVVGQHRFREDGYILELFPHMHNRGTAFRYELVQPDGTIEPLLDVPRYDFNWQILYTPARPIFAPAGAVLRATGWFDNSAENPGNPDPTAEVRFGEQTWEEMMIGYFDWVAAAKRAPAIAASHSVFRQRP
jgi:mono/diheme cytochrome c family protein